MQQAGFAKTDALVAIVVVLVLALGGFVYAQKHGTPSGNAAATAAHSNLHEHKPADAQPVVQKAFDAALGYARTPAHTPQGSVDIIKPYLSPGLYGTLTKQVSGGTKHNVVLCGQSVPDSAQAVLNDTADGIATVLVNEAFGASRPTVTTTVDLKTLKIVSLTCPPGV